MLTAVSRRTTFSPVLICVCTEVWSSGLNHRRELCERLHHTLKYDKKKPETDCLYLLQFGISVSIVESIDFVSSYIASAKHSARCYLGKHFLLHSFFPAFLHVYLFVYLLPASNGC